MTILDGIPFLPAVHFTEGREHKIDTLVLHWMATTLAGCDRTFTDGARRASAHFGIEDATIHGYVREGDTAWHAGNWDANSRSIGIEHSAQPATKTSPARDASPATIATSVALCVALCRKYGISPDRIFPHKMFTATACPGTLPIAEIVARVRAELAAVHVAPVAPSRASVRPPIVAPKPVPTGVLNVRTIDLRDVTPPVTGPGVKPLQRLLSVGVDGLAGPATRAALVAAQKRCGLTADAIFGPNTANALLSGK